MIRRKLPRVGTTRTGVPTGRRLASRSGLGWLLLLMVAAGPGFAGNTLEERVQVRQEVHEFLVRLGSIHEGPSRERLFEHRLQEMWRAVGPWSDLVLESLGHYLRNPEAEFDECTIARAVDPFGAKLPDKAVKVLLKGMPTRNAAGDRCLTESLGRLGPPAYPALIKCGRIRSASKAGTCLSVLVEQSGEVPGANSALGLGDELGLPALPKGREAIHRVAARWESWWNDQGPELRWNAERARLEAGPD